MVKTKLSVHGAGKTMVVDAEQKKRRKRDPRKMAALIRKYHARNRTCVTAEGMRKIICAMAQEYARELGLKFKDKKEVRVQRSAVTLMAVRAELKTIDTMRNAYEISSAASTPTLDALHISIADKIAASD